MSGVPNTGVGMVRSANRMLFSLEAPTKLSQIFPLRAHRVRPKLIQ